MQIVIIVITFVIIYFIIKLYLIKYDTIIAYTGGLGSGKSLMSAKMAVKLTRKNRGKVWRYNHIWYYVKRFFSKKEKKDNIKKINDRPMLYSSIPLNFRTNLFSKKEWSIELTEEHLLLQKKINEKSVVFIDEIGSFANQFQYKNPNILDNFNEFVRLFRHYTKGGYFVCNDQCSENIVLEVRRRINQVYNLMHFKKFWFIYIVKIRNISISEEIKTIEEQNTEDNMRTLIGFMPSKGLYDTYCYSERYNTVPLHEEKKYKKLKKNTLLSVSLIKKEKKTTSKEEPIPTLTNKPLEGQKALNHGRKQ